MLTSPTKQSLLFIAAGVILVSWCLSPGSSSPKTSSTRINRNTHTTGIKRIGVTCYLNSLLQVLSTSERFVVYISEMREIIVALNDEDKNICVSRDNAQQVDNVIDVGRYNESQQDKDISVSRGNKAQQDKDISVSPDNNQQQQDKDKDIAVTQEYKQQKQKQQDNHHNQINTLPLGRLHLFLYDVLVKLQGDSPYITISREEIRNLESLTGRNLLQQNDWLEILALMVGILEKERDAVERHVVKSKHRDSEDIKPSKISCSLPQLPFYGTVSTHSYCVSCRRSPRNGSNLASHSQKSFSLTLDMTTYEPKKETFERKLLTSMWESIDDYTCSYCSVEHKIKTNAPIDPMIKKRFHEGDIFINDDVELQRRDHKKHTLVRHNTFVEYPETLIISLNWFKYSYSGQFSRVTNIYCDYPKVLDLDGRTYRLNNLIKHSGGVRTGGHFQVFKRKPVLVKKKYRNRDTGKLEMIEYELKRAINRQESCDSGKEMYDHVELVSATEYNPYDSQTGNDFWLVNDEKSRQVSLVHEINPSHSNSITGLVYERVG